MFLAWHEEPASFVIAAKAILFDFIVETSDISNCGFIFTTSKNYEEIKKILNLKKKFPHLLIDITENLHMRKIYGFFPDVQIKSLKEINIEKLDIKLDDVLDKMIKTGKESLDKDEQIFLENYGKQ